MKFILKIMLPSLILILTTGIQTSYADCMRISAASCIVDESIDPNSYIRVGSFIKHRGTATDTIKIFCPLNIHGVNYQYVKDFYMYSEDAYEHELDVAWGEATQPNNVSAYLQNVNYSGNINTLLKIDSNSYINRRTGEWGEMGFHQLRQSGESRTKGTIRMDFTEGPNWYVGKGGLYYVEAFIKRSNRSKNPSFAGVSFCGDTKR